MNLLSLEDWNSSITTTSPDLVTPVKNGIACPNCEKELYDTYPNQTLTSFPPQKQIHCSECDYTGYRRC